MNKNETIKITKKLFGNFIRIDTKDGKGGYLIQNTIGGRKIAADLMKELYPDAKI